MGWCKKGETFGQERADCVPLPMKVKFRNLETIKCPLHSNSLPHWGERTIGPGLIPNRYIMEWQFRNYQVHVSYFFISRLPISISRSFNALLMYPAYP